MRFTNFVEIMCPCFSRHALELCRPYFRENRSGWGLDFLFPKLLGFPNRSIGIVDAATIIHTRPVGGPLHKLVRESGSSPSEDLDRLRAVHGFASRQDNLAVLRPDGTISEDLTGVNPLIFGANRL
jgi:hypothetical protein